MIPNAGSQPVVAVTDLVRSFGSKQALAGISLEVMPGHVFGLVGENGAGKTTLIRHILGLYKVQSGSVRVFGYDPVTHQESVLSRIGYLSEEPDLPPWMTVSELMKYTSVFYEGWDADYAAHLLNAFQLPHHSKVKNLSKGQRARAGLILAQAHRPDLLLLDEPSSGLDPIVRRDILEAVIRTVVDEGRTVLFSSHLLDEVSRVSDVVTMISRGRLMLSDDLSHILAQHHRVLADTNPQIPEVFQTRQKEDHWELIMRGEWQQIQAQLTARGVAVKSREALTLDEIFVLHSGVSAKGEA